MKEIVDKRARFRQVWQLLLAPMTIVVSMRDPSHKTLRYPFLRSEVYLILEVFYTNITFRRVFAY